MNVEEWLKRVKELDDLIDEKLSKHGELWAIATETTAKVLDGMPFDNMGTVSRKVEDGAIKLAMLSKEIDRLTDEFVDHKQAVIKILNKLPEDERTVLYMFYIEYRKYEHWNQIGIELGYNRMKIWRIRQRAYYMLCQALDCYTVKC